MRDGLVLLVGVLLLAAGVALYLAWWLSFAGAIR